MKVVQDFVPPEWASSTIQGFLSPTFTIEGALPDGQFLGTIQAGLQAKDLQVTLPSLTLDLGPSTLDIQAKDIDVKNNQPTGGKLSTKTTIQDLSFQTYRLHNLDVAVTGDGLMAGPFSGALNVSGSTMIPPDIVGAAITLPFDFNPRYERQPSHSRRTRQSSCPRPWQLRITPS